MIICTYNCSFLLFSHSFKRELYSRSPLHSRSPTSSSTSHSHSSKRRTESRSHKQRSKSSSSRRSRTQSPPRRRSRSRSPRHSSSNRHQSRPHSPRSRRHRYYMHCRTEKLVYTFTSAIYFSTSWTIRSLISKTLPSFFCCFSMYFLSLLQLNAPTHSTHLEW